MNLRLPRRLGKFLADARVGSRVHIERVAAAGEIQFNGAVERNLRRLVDPQRDVVAVNGQLLKISAPRVYALLHKPAGVVTTLADSRGLRTVAELIPTQWRGSVGVVGRLDKPTTGALLLTDDGDLSHLLTAPAFHVWKRYVITVLGEPSDDDPRLTQLREGVLLGEVKTQPAKCGVVPNSGRPGRGTSRLSDVWLEIREGRFRQVRRMANSVKLKVVRLHREAIGPLPLGMLAEGDWRMLTDVEVDALYDAAGGKDAPAKGAERALVRRLNEGSLEPADAHRVRRYLAMAG